MRRGTRRSLVHLTLFGCILFLIIYINRPQSNKKKAFAWTRIRYKTTAAKLPEARGICPGLEKSTKPALIVSRVAADGDPSWLDALSDLYHLCVYTVDAPVNSKSKYLQVPENRGHESMAYLTFLIDNYDHIPKAGAVFVHGNRWAWHNDAPDYDNAALLAALNVPAAVAPWGYHNMRCDWSVSTCPPSTAGQRSIEVSLQAALEPWNARAVSDKALPRALAALFGGYDHLSAKNGGGFLLGRTDAVRSQCCAQFVVSRESVWQHSREEYVALRQWLLDGSSGNGVDKHSKNPRAAPASDLTAGRILSYLWHILFIKHDSYDEVDLDRLNSQACPRADECYCRLYGRCNLERCKGPGSCLGQYRLPPDFKLPDDWAATHS
ncbi:hypothetical protein ASPWEDRAFT_119565 [Aspergillus wentii DTO 134E9]|uniref:Uncharacterized protein n=1 Tax=Aspergillus wentii DTO 134E9 TaxID=1073089 RepID=A0A1L9R805_ASPWE|nr:uncharacterized protein ASPWEDRAFT_119565 [Aspergillus wentii DTO 134E9]KAI9927654.1 hypothetical protein MW887_003275 [Aspergillus wentii]OJJ31034.1 hypothetical protein ASPWEDRAFT_119565 [Aspergillus wentii DTO 134E9]